jgi:arylsulfatase
VRKRTLTALAILALIYVAGISPAVDAQKKPNIIFILVDDMGWSDVGCYGGEINTPNIDGLAKEGIRFTQCYNTAKCFPSRATLLTGVYAQQCGMGEEHAAIRNAVTLGEVLRPAGYRTFASGKHHGTENLYDRGFDHYYGLRDGCCNFWNPGKKREGEPEPGRKRTRHWCDDEKNYSPFTPGDRNFYATDAFTDKALAWLNEPETGQKPFFLYLAYNAPHYPLHAWPDDIAKYKGVYDDGYEAVQKARYERQIKMGLIDPKITPMPRSPKPGSWQALSGENLEKMKLRMEIYAAMLDRVDQNVGRILDKLRKQDRLDNTLIFFASDNGGCAEGTGAKVKSTKIEDFGKVASYETVGKNWATVQNTPFRFWKNYSHEGGICTPLIVKWSGKISKPGSFCREPVHFIDVMSTLVDITGAVYPKIHKGKPVTPMQGTSILPALQGNSIERELPLFWQWKRGGGVREGNMKAVLWNGKWEIYDIAKDRNENNDLAESKPEQLQAMMKTWKEWYVSVGGKKK